MAQRMIIDCKRCYDTRREIMRLVLLLCLLANPDGDCTKSGDCPRGEYCKSGTCVPKGEDNGR